MVASKWSMECMSFLSEAVDHGLARHIRCLISDYDYDDMALLA